MHYRFMDVFFLLRSSISIYPPIRPSLPLKTLLSLQYDCSVSHAGNLFLSQTQPTTTLITVGTLSFFYLLYCAQG